MIPRTSLWTIEKLRDELMLAALRVTVPKWKLMLRALTGAFAMLALGVLEVASGTYGGSVTCICGQWHIT